MTDSDFDFLEQEIAAMSSAEEKADYNFWVKKIINEHSALMKFISDLHDNPPLKKESNVIFLSDVFYINPNGFELRGMEILIKENMHLAIKKGSEVIFELSEKGIKGDKSIIKSIAKEINELIMLFKHEAKQEMKKRKTEAMAAAEAFWA